MTDPAPTPSIPAATLILLRAASAGPPEILMVERAKAMAFAGGALVFPGGRVDPGDHALASLMGRDDDDTAARIAAIRETIEEVGLAIGLSPAPSTTVLATLRTALHAGMPFAQVLADANLQIDVDALAYFARWLPAHAAARVFDTRFYMARLPDDAPAPRVDATENVRLFWSTAADVLADADAGRVTIIFPTRRNLERLAQFADVDAAFAHVDRYPVRTVTPWIETRDGIDHLCIPDDLGYPITTERLTDAVRG
ncbi:NUDIX domain-containing protein [Sphingomonas sp. PB2P12]|uniref:NUDIX hydrolase n=1 Tax=Sphingomonas sandaracina TaxID=3096157 RepID=UPI002FC9626D